MIASWTPSFALSSLLHTETPAVAEQPGSPAVQVSSQASSQICRTADQAAAQPVSAQPVSQTQPPATAAPAVTSADSAQMLQSMARDLATMGQQIEQLKANIEQIKASQEKSPAARPEPPRSSLPRSGRLRPEHPSRARGPGCRRFRHGRRLHLCAGRGLHIRPRKPQLLPPCRQSSQAPRQCSLNHPYAQRPSRTANQWCGHRCPCVSK